MTEPKDTSPQRMMLPAALVLTGIAVVAPAAVYFFQSEARTELRLAQLEGQILLGEQIATLRHEQLSEQDKYIVAILEEIAATQKLIRASQESIRKTQAEIQATQKDIRRDLGTFRQQ